MTEPRHGPLADIQVVELGTTIAGPFCARLLADFGADVVKIEPLDGDPIRTVGTGEQGSGYAATLMRNKRLISVDIRNPEGRSILVDLLSRTDVLVENYRPGVLEAWELGPAQLHDINPRLIIVRISGFGQTGPYKTQAGYGIVAEAMSGLRELTGDEDRPPARVQVALTDYITGLYAAFGIMMALKDRESSGQGQMVDAALYESAFSFLEGYVPSYAKSGYLPTRSGARMRNQAPNNLYHSKDGRYIHIAANSDRVFERLAQAMGQPELAQDSRFATNRERNRRESEIDEIVSRWVSDNDLSDIEDALLAAKVPASRIYNLADIFADPHYRARDMLVETARPDGETVTLTGVVPKLSRSPGHIDFAGGDIGQNTNEVLREQLGYSEERLDSLREAGVIR